MIDMWSNRPAINPLLQEQLLNVTPRQVMCVLHDGVSLCVSCDYTARSALSHV